MLLNIRFSGAALVVIASFVGPAVGAQNPGGDVRLLKREREIRSTFDSSSALIGRPYMTQMRLGETKTIEFGFERGRYLTYALCELEVCGDLRIELFDSQGRRVPLVKSSLGDTSRWEWPVIEYVLAGFTDMRLRVSLGRCSYNPCWVLITSVAFSEEADRPATTLPAPSPAMTLTGARLTVAPTLVLERLMAVASPQSVPTRFFRELGLRPATQQMPGRARYIVAGLAFEYVESLNGAIVVSRSIGSQTQWFLTDRGGGLRAAIFETSGTLDGPYTSVPREAAEGAFRETLASWNALLSQ